MFDPDVAWLVANARTMGYDYLADLFSEHLESVASAASLNASSVRDPYSRACTQTSTVIAAAATWLREHNVPEPNVKLIISR